MTEERIEELERQLKDAQTYIFLILERTEPGSDAHFIAKRAMKKVWGIEIVSGETQEIPAATA